MSLKLLGAICVVLGCGGCGFLMTVQHKAKVKELSSFITALEYMCCELEYRATSLPQLCRQASQQNKCKVHTILKILADELDTQISPDVRSCMAVTIGRVGELDVEIHSLLLELGNNLGRFDIGGQVQGLQHISQLSQDRLRQLTLNQDSRLRSYQTLGLCAGAAIAILLV